MTATSLRPDAAHSQHRRSIMKPTSIAACVLAVLSLAQAHAQPTQPQAPAAPFANKPADAIFEDHPSMDSNAVVLPAAGARPVSQFFADRPLLDASVARAEDGTWYLTGTVIREGRRDGVQLWSRGPAETNWTHHGPVVGEKHRYLAPEVRVRGGELFLAYADDQGCARVAKGSAAQPKGSFRESGCLVPDVSDVSIFLDDDGAAYLLWGAGHIARLKPDLSALAEAPRFLKPDPKLFAVDPPAGKDWPVRLRVGERGANMFKLDGRYFIAASEATGRMRTATEDLFMAEGPTPYGPFSKRFLAAPHASAASVVLTPEGPQASYNPRCEDDFAMFCEKVGLVPLERAPDGRLRQSANVLTEDSAVAARRALVTSETMRDPSVALGHDGYYYLVGTLNGYGYQKPQGGVKLWRSKDLASWEPQGFIFDWKGMGYEFRNAAELWAPEIMWSAKDRTYYLAFSVMERGVGGKTWLYRSTSGRAAGPYENVRDGYFVEGIDGFPFEDEDGLYLLWGGGRLGKLNAKRDGFEGEPTRLVDTDGDHIGYEGNGLIKVGDTYFITGAEWNGPLRTHGTYDMMYGVSKSLRGPYAKRRLGAPHAGHGTAFRDKEGRYWYSMFGNDVTAPWRMHFGLIPLIIGDDDAIRVPGLDSPEP